MSYERGLNAINLKKTDKIACHEFLAHPEFMHKVTGIDPYKSPRKAYIEAYKALDVDMAWVVFDTATKVGQDEIAEREDGRKASKWGTFITYGESTRPIADVDEILSYDAMAEFDTKYKPVAEFEVKRQKELQQEFGNATLVPGVINCTCFHWLQNTFEMQAFMVAAMEYPDDFANVIDGFGEVSYEMARLWLTSDVKAIVSHDDIAMSHSLFFPPQWLAKHIIPWYKEIWGMLTRNGIKVIYLSDGQYSDVVDDIAGAGASGFMFEPMVDLQMMTQKFGGRKVLMGNTKTSVLTVGTKEEITKEVERCIKTAGKYPGYFLCATGSLPHNIPLENLEHYFSEVARLRKR